MMNEVCLSNKFNSTQHIESMNRPYIGIGDYGYGYCCKEYGCPSLELESGETVLSQIISSRGG